MTEGIVVHVDLFLQDAPEPMLKRMEAAKYIQRSVGTLEKWAAHKKGPRFIRVGGRTLYPVAELQAYLDAQRAWQEVQSRGGEPVTTDR